MKRRLLPAAARDRLHLLGRQWLPQGRALSEHDASWRHRVVLVLLALHLPALVAVGVLAGRPLLGTLLSLVPAGVLVAVACGPFQRRTRSLAASVGLLTCSAALVHLLPHVPQAWYHYFVTVAVVALYQDWAVYAAAIGFVVGAQLLSRVLADPSDAHGVLWRIAVHGGFVLAESAVLVMFWRADERARDGEARLQRALWEGQSSVRARLEETERIRTDLIGTVSHEFRTPLTGIRGAALTLLKRGDRLDETGRRRLLEGILHQQERLSRLLENMLTAARATAADPGAVAEVDAVAAEVSMLAGATGTGRPAVSLVVEPGLAARIERQALHQVLANLVDNAHQHGKPGSVPLLAAGRDGNEVWLAVSNEGGPLDERAADLLFEPFTQGDASATRLQEGLGMGLYVVRRLVDVYGGRLAVRAQDGWVTVELRLQSARDGAGEELRVQTPAPTALPTR